MVGHPVQGAAPRQGEWRRNFEGRSGVRLEVAPGAPKISEEVSGFRESLKAENSETGVVKGGPRAGEG